MSMKRKRHSIFNKMLSKNELEFFTEETIIKFRFKILLIISVILGFFKILNIFVDNLTLILILIIMWLGINIIYSNLIKTKKYTAKLDFFSVIIDTIFVTLLIGISGTLETPVYLLYYFIIFIISFKYNKIGALLLISIMVSSYYSLLVFYQNIIKYNVNNYNEFIKILSFIFIFIMFEIAKKFKDKTKTLNKKIAQKHDEVLSIKKDLERVNRKLEHKNSRYKDMMSFITHELKNPLTSVTSLSNLYLNDDNDNLNSEQLQALNVIHRNAVNMEAMINEYMNLDKLDRGDIQPKYETVHIENDIIIPMIEELHNDLNNYKIEIKNETPLLFNNLTVITDKHLFKMIYSNLFKNAIKYGYRESIIHYGIKITGNVKNFYVKNKGKSIPKKNIKSIFNKYERLERDAKIQGSGIGLYNCKKIVESLNGHIYVESSEIYETTTFYFNISS